MEIKTIIYISWLSYLQKLQKLYHILSARLSGNQLCHLSMIGIQMLQPHEGVSNTQQTAYTSILELVIPLSGIYSKMNLHKHKQQMHAVIHLPSWICQKTPEQPKCTFTEDWLNTTINPHSGKNSEATFKNEKNLDELLWTSSGYAVKWKECLVKYISVYPHTHTKNSRK